MSGRAGLSNQDTPTRLEDAKTHPGALAWLLRDLGQTLFNIDRGPWWRPDRSAQHSLQLIEHLTNLGHSVRVEKAVLYGPKSVPLKLFRVTIHLGDSHINYKTVHSDRRLAVLYCTFKAFELVLYDNAEEELSWMQFTN